MLVTITVIVSLAIAMFCLIDLWNKKCSVMRRILWSPIPFIPFLGPMLYYALFEPPPVRQDEDEDIESRAFSIDEVREMIATGAIIDLKTVAGLALMRQPGSRRSV